MLKDTDVVEDLKIKETAKRRGSRRLLETQIAAKDSPNSVHLLKEEDGQTLQQDQVAHDSKEVGGADDSGEVYLDREKLVEQFSQLLDEKRKLLDCHAAVQMKITEQWKKKLDDEDGDEGDVAPPKEKDVNDKNRREAVQRFNEELSMYRNMKQGAIQACESFHKDLFQKNEECQKQRNHLTEKKSKFYELRDQVVSRIVQDPRTKVAIAKLLSTEDDKDSEIETARLKNIRIRIKIEKMEAKLRAKDQLAEGFNVLDFEQLRVSNQANGEKIEEKNEKILELKRKVTNSVQALTHAKEKLNFLEKSLVRERENLVNVEKLVAKMRDELSHDKVSRDSLRQSVNKMKATGGLLDNKSLLGDFENCFDSCQNMRNSLNRLKNDYSMLRSRLKSSN